MGIQEILLLDYAIRNSRIMRMQTEKKGGKFTVYFLHVVDRILRFA